MARNGAGVYSKVNTFVAGNTITAAGHNQNWDDAVSEITNSVAADGQTTITGPIKFANGTVLLPALTFASDPNSGFYRIGADNVGLALNGAKVADYSTTGVAFTGTLGASSDFAIATSKFTVTASTGATSVAGILTQGATSHGLLARGTTAQRAAAAAGQLRYNSDLGYPEYSDASNFFPLSGIPLGAQMRCGDIYNGTLIESHSGSAVTFALKTLAGNDPSAGDPVVLAFRNATIATGNYVYRTVTAALSLVISSGSTMGATSAAAFKLWLVIFDDGGTIRLGAINTVSGTSIYPLGQVPLASSTAEGGAGAADSAQVFYTGTAVTTKSYIPLGYASYESGLATAGTWGASPTRLHLFGPGDPLPGATIQTVSPAFGTLSVVTFTTSATSTNVTASITPTSAANLVKYSVQTTMSANGANNKQFAQMYRGSTAIGAFSAMASGTADQPSGISFVGMDAPGSSSSTTYVVKGGNASGVGTGSIPSAGANSATEILEEIMT